MLKYPTCAKTFTEFYQNSKSLTHKYISKLIKVRPFDVTLRDGLQSLNVNEQEICTTKFKKNIYNLIVEKYNPVSLEIGSCVSKKVLPIFEDTEQLFRSIKDDKNKYVLVPNIDKLIDAIQFGVTNFSFITSVSNSFQYKNTKMTKNENRDVLKNMLNILENNMKFKLEMMNYDVTQRYPIYSVKLYVSCVNECPIEGQIPTNQIVEDLYEFSRENYDKICLSDTCGSLSVEDFYEIISNLNELGADMNKFSLHLHIKPEKEREAQEIVHTAIDFGINEFDVSYLQSGGCSVTMNKHKLAPNMTYEQYYRFLTNYLLKKS